MPKKKVAPPTKASPAPKTKPVAKPKKPIEKQKPTRKLKKQQQEQQSPEEIEKQSDDQESPQSEVSNSNQNDRDDQDEDDDNDDDDDDESGSDDDEESSQSSITPVKPENYAVKQMQFRERRGTKMNYLMNRKKEQEEDPFWAEHKGLFGDLNGEDDEDDEEDYVQSSSGKDQFDSDFGQTQSQHDDPEQDGKKMVEEVDQQKEKQKKRRAELMKKVNAYKEKPSQKIQKTQRNEKNKSEIKTETVSRKQKPEQKIQQQVGNRFIHQIFTQEQLLGEAAHTQYYNWLSLKKLISIETEKKDFTRKIKHVDGNKVIYKNRMGENGTAATSYELCGVTVNDVKDLTNFWLAK